MKVAGPFHEQGTKEQRRVKPTKSRPAYKKKTHFTFSMKLPISSMEFSHLYPSSSRDRMLAVNLYTFLDPHRSLRELSGAIQVIS
jgi:hypothetical protein